MAKNGDRINMLARYELTKRQAREGNPLPFIKFQWESVLRIYDQPAVCEGKHRGNVDCPECAEAKWFAKGLRRDDWTDLRLDDFQVAIAEHAFRPDITEIFIKGATKPGKGFVVAMLVNVWFDIWDDARVIVTSSNATHAKTTMFAEIVNLRRMMRLPGPNINKPARIGAEEVRHTEKRRILVANPETGEGFSGAHSDHTMFVFDEASGVPDDLYGNATKQSRLTIALSNPRMLTGWFRDGFPLDSLDETQVIPTRLGRRYCVSVDGADCYNVRNKRLTRPVAPPGGITLWEHLPGRKVYKEGEIIPDNIYKYIKPGIPSQVDYAIYLANCADPDKTKVAWSAHGKFPTEDADFQVILPSWLKRHEEAWLARDAAGNPVPVEAFGLDVSRSIAGDDTVLASGSEQGIRALHVTKSDDATEIMGWVLQTVQREYGIDLTDGSVPIGVDAQGLGGPVCDRLKELGVWVIDIMGSRTPDVRKEVYLNKRTECYGELADRLNPEGAFSDPWCLPPDPRLREELVAPEKIYRSDGVKYGLTPKEKTPAMKKQTVADNRKTIKEKIGRSPDRADSVVYLYAAVRELRGEEVPKAEFTLIPSQVQDVTMQPKASVVINGVTQKGCTITVSWGHDELAEMDVPQDLEAFLKLECPI